MSKRGTRSAKFIAGKDWSNGAKGNPVAKNMKLAKVLKKREFLKLKFDELISSFGLKSNEAYVKPYYYTFLNVLSLNMATG